MATQSWARLCALAISLAAFCLISPEVLARGPDRCLWRHLFQLASCPACGSTRALAAVFHARFSEALAFNHNVAVTAPLLLVLFGKEIWRALGRVVRKSRAG